MAIVVVLSLLFNQGSVPPMHATSSIPGYAAYAAIPAIRFCACMLERNDGGGREGVRERGGKEGVREKRRSRGTRE